MKNLKLLVIVVSFTLLVVNSSCSAQNKKVYKEKGKLHKNIIAKFDSTITYNLYLPQNREKSPLLVIFDAHGKTETAMTQYIPLAEKYGIAMAGFDASSNQTPFEKTSSRFKEWINELAATAPVDTARLFATGFSGGARVVAMLESRYPFIDAVGLCGAGAGDMHTWMQSKKKYMGFCGTGDFNYQEFVRMSQLRPDKNNFAYRLFHGKHEWPAAEVFEPFFALIAGMSGNPANYPGTDYYSSLARKEMQSGRPDIALTVIDVAFICNGAATDQKLLSLYDSIGNSISKSFRESYHKALEKEMRTQQYLQQLFGKADSLHYKNWLDSLNSNMPKDSLNLEYDANSRLKAYCGIIAYSYVNRAMEGDFPTAYALLRMYQMTEPQNNEMLFCLAQYHARKGNCGKSEYFLEQAVANGFNDHPRMQNCKDFGNCPHSKKLQKIIYGK